MKKSVLCAGLVCAAGVSFASVISSQRDNVDITVTANYRTFFNTNVTLTAAVPKPSGYPASVGTPLYWLDASDTAGWEFDTANPNEVRKLANKGTADRYLTSVHSEILAEANYKPNPTQSPLWYGALGSIRGPLLCPASGRLKGPYIDFGAAKSMRALFFNPAVPAGETPETCAPSNRLYGIGTVIGVYRSNGGGGQVIGGSQWQRWSGYTPETSGTNLFESIVVNGGCQEATAWQNFRRCMAKNDYWTGDWETVAVNPKTSTCHSEGVGCGNPNGLDSKPSCSGQAIAELLVYDRNLSDNEIREVLVYLEKKWFGNDPEIPGVDGRSQVTWLTFQGSTPGASSSPSCAPLPGIEVPVTVPADQTMTIGKLNGGRALEKQPQKLVKQGAGTLKLDDARNFGGVVTLQEGALRLGGRPMPTALPEGALLHFDFSDIATITRDEANCVSSVTNKGSADCVLAQASEAHRPDYLADLPQTGLATLDCRERNQDNGGYFNITPAQNVRTMFFVVDRRIYAGAQLADGPFSAPTDWTYSNYAWDGSTYARFFKSSAIANAEAWVNGLPVDVNAESVEMPGFNVIALNNAPGLVSVIGKNNLNNCGGSRFCEVIAYDRPLTDREILDVQAILMKKWLGRTAPGYANDTDVFDVQRVACANGVTIDVPAGQTASVGTVAGLTPDAVFYKTGAGTLRLGPDADVANGLVVREGTVVRTAGSDATAKCGIAAEPAMHLDASRSDLLKTHEQNGTNFVWCWEDDAGRVSALRLSADIAYSTPFLLETDKLNGLQTVNFGPYANSWSNSKGCQLGISKNLFNVRAVYMVVGTDGQGAQILGVSNMSNIDRDLLTGRNTDFCASGSTKLFASACSAVTSGELYIDGVKTNTVSGYQQPAGYNLIELHTTAGCKFNCLGNGWEGYYHGGFRLGEIVVFERPLSERERVATRNYLLKKWFAKTDAELSPLPEKPALQPVKANLMSPAAGERISIAADGAVRNLGGEGTIEVAGGAAFAADDLTDFAGVVDVKDGTFTITRRTPAVEPRMVTEDRSFHFDATDAEHTVPELDAEGNEVVREWRSLVDDGLVCTAGAERPYNEGSAVYPPILMRGELNGRDVINMSWDKWNGKHRWYRFTQDGEFVSRNDVRACFWIVGSQEGGGHLLGGGLTDDVPAPLYRPSGSGSVASGPIFSTNQWNTPKARAKWTLNFASMDPTKDGLSGAYDLMGMNFDEADADDPLTGILGFAYSGLFLKNTNYQDYVSRQRLGEIIAYNRILTDEEYAGVEAYLGAKWGFCQRSTTNQATVAVGPAATLVTTENAYVDTLAGSGAVEGDVTVRNFVADAAEDGLSVSGTLTIAAHPTVTVANVPADVKPGTEIVIAEATEYAGTENLADLTAFGDVVDCGDFKVSVRIRKGKLTAKLVPFGMMLLVR